MSPSAKERVERHLRNGCDRCRSAKATLTLRGIDGAPVRPELQCDGCGKSLSAALPRNDHYQAFEYPPFDIAKMNQFFVDRTVSRLENREGFQAQVAFTAEERSRAYQDRLRLDPRWQDLRLRVLRRAGNVCEGCLSQRAEHVHHLTYQFGILPPAWTLKAVCRDCHDRLHADKRGMVDEWCLKSPPKTNDE